MLLDRQIPIEILRKYVKDNLLKVGKHPTLPLLIWNYTPLTQYGKHWDEITRMCRGLITTETGEIVGRPFPKFFNLGEVEETKLENLPSFGEGSILEKVDGSLIIVCHYNGEPIIATRGSFSSYQAESAAKWLLMGREHRYRKSDFQEEHTYLFEWISPNNRIVVDYGEREELVYLTTIYNKTGLDSQLNNNFFYPYTKAKLFSSENINELIRYMNSIPNNEGAVIYWDNGLRVKIKADEYVRLHRIITGCSSITIWEALKDGKELDLEKVPDEFYQWVQNYKNKLNNEFGNIKYLAQKTHNNVMLEEFKTRKEQALYIKSHCVINEYFGRDFNLPSLVFLLLDNKDITEAIWKLLRPEFEKPSYVKEE